MESTPPFAALALAITEQDWTALGFSDDPNVAATDDLETIVDRLTALLLVRTVAVASKPGTYANLSTTTICREALTSNKPWPDPITDQVISQLKEFVRRIISTYSTYQDIPYHNMEHAYHVTISVNKLVDLILNTDIRAGDPVINTFGLRKDPLMHLVIVFSGLIHDAEHTGLPNRQLCADNDPLAILYNDQSVAENRSLYIAFSELLKPEFEALRNVIFPSKDDYQRFRKAVLNLVLCTDIASPERTQIGKSKWKEAFGDPFETVERKVRSEIRRRQSMSQGKTPMRTGRRASAASMGSMYSEITTDIPEGLQDDEQSSESVTPDSSYGEDYSTDNELDQSMDGVIVTGKPFSAQTTGGVVNATDLGYEPTHPQSPVRSDNNGSKSNEELRKELEYGNSHASLDGSGHEDPHKRSQNRFKALANKGVGKTSRNLSMSSLKSLPMPSHETMYNPKQMSKFQRRFSTSTIQGAGTKRYKYRLGILRTVDLSGESIESYSRHSAVGAQTSMPQSATVPISNIEMVEEVDELKMTVIMEQLMLAADVAHNLQGWDHMVKWSNRLFLELKRAHQQGRGGHPQNNWYGNQIGFLESYLLPLARRMEDMGVFGDVIGPVFVRIVEANRDRWLQHGMGVSTSIILEGAKQFPVDGDVTQ